MLPAAVARSSSDNSTTCYVLSVLFSHNGANEPKSGTALCFVQFAGWRHSGRSLLSATAYWFKLYLKYNSSADKYKQCHQIASVTLQLRRLRLLVCATASSVILSTPRADAWVGFSSLFVCLFSRRYLKIRCNYDNHTWYTKCSTMSPGNPFILGQKVICQGHNFCLCLSSDRMPIFPPLLRTYATLGFPCFRHVATLRVQNCARSRTKSELQKVLVLTRDLFALLLARLISQYWFTHCRLPSVVVCNARGRTAAAGLGVWPIRRPTLHGGTVRLSVPLGRHLVCTILDNISIDTEGHAGLSMITEPLVELDISKNHFSGPVRAIGRMCACLYVSGRLLN